MLIHLIVAYVSRLHLLLFNQMLMEKLTFLLLKKEVKQLLQLRQLILQNQFQLAPLKSQHVLSQVQTQRLLNSAEFILFLFLQQWVTIVWSVSCLSVQSLS